MKNEGIYQKERKKSKKYLECRDKENQETRNNMATGKTDIFGFKKGEKFTPNTRKFDVKKCLNNGYHRVRLKGFKCNKNDKYYHLVRAKFRF